VTNAVTNYSVFNFSLLKEDENKALYVLLNCFFQ